MFADGLTRNLKFINVPEPENGEMPAALINTNPAMLSGVCL